MKNLVITMESTADLPKEIVEEKGFAVFDMQFCVGENEYSTETHSTQSSEIYKKMRDGQKTSTSQINQFLYQEHFQKLLEQQKTILHIGFSSGLSGSLFNAQKVAEELNKSQKRIFVVDSLVGSVGQGMLALKVFEFAKTCEDINEIEKYANELAKKMNAFFTVDNLKYLALGGRISKAKAVIGNMLAIKPIIHATNEGKLENGEKVISRKKSLQNLANKYCEKRDAQNPEIFIAHADSPNDVNFLKDLIFQKSKIVADVFEIGPVMGSHCGPGTIAIFFWGSQR